MVAPITTVLVPAPAPAAPAVLYDLTDLATIHDELKLPATDTASDAWLGRAITQASTQMRLYVKQPFQIETVLDQYLELADPWPRRAAPLLLSRFPLVNITTLVTSDDTPAGAVLMPFAATTGVAAGQVVSGVAIPVGTTTQPVAVGTTVAGTPTPTSVTLSAPTAGDIPAGTSVTFGISAVQQVGQTTLKLLAAAVANFAGGDFQFDAPHGQLLRLNPVSAYQVSWEPYPLNVIYSAGYAAVPADVVDACLRLITERWHGRGRDPYLKENEQPGSGRQTWWVGGPPKTGVLPLEIEGLLDQYRVPTVG